MKCWKCNADMPEGTKYCGNCGAKIGANSLEQRLYRGINWIALGCAVLALVLVLCFLGREMLEGPNFEEFWSMFGGNDETQPDKEELNETEPDETEEIETEPEETPAPETEPEEPEIIQISAGGWGTYALWSDGRVTATGRQDGNARYDWDQFSVGSWRDIVFISAGDTHVAGIRKDGTAVAKGENTDGRCDISHWRNLQSISAGTYTTVGLREDGTVVAAGAISNEDMKIIESWTDVVQVCAGETYTAALKSDGTVVAAGNISWKDLNALEQWQDITQISVGVNYTVGLREDGTVLQVGTIQKSTDSVAGWRDVVALSAGDYFVVGLCRNGTVLAVGDNTYGQCSGTDTWRGITAISARWGHVVGMREGGGLTGTGWNKFDQFDMITLKNRSDVGNQNTVKIDITVKTEPRETEPRETEPKETKPAETEPKIDATKGYLAAYKSILQKTIDASYAGTGFLYDMDQDGIEELVLLYQDGAEYVNSVYDLDEGNVVAKLDKKSLIVLAGAPQGYVEVANYEGRIVFIAYSANGSVEGLTSSRSDWHDIYDAESFEIIASTHLKTVHDYEEDTETKECSINKKRCSYEEYLKVVDAVEPIAGTVAWYNDYAYEVGMSLADLLDYICKVAG